MQDNSYYRELQTIKLVNKILKKSSADVILLGGDLNAEPNSKSYNIVRTYMNNSIEDVHASTASPLNWLKPEWATYNNKRVFARPCEILKLPRLKVYVTIVCILHH